MDPRRALFVLVLAAIGGCGAGPATETAALSDDGGGCSNVAPGPPHSCAQQAAWGKCDEPWMEGYCLASCDRCPLSALPVDADATPETRALLSYLVAMKGDAILSGQQGRAEAAAIEALTGRAPAILGVDLMDDSPSRVARGTESVAVDDALGWWHTQDGIVTLSWHWNAPSHLVDSAEWPWWKGFYAKATHFDLVAAMNDPQSAERASMVRDIDAIATSLRRLADAGVPVLWRPLHEASGGWFWWGAHGPEPYLALWHLMQQRLVEHHGLHNLIWVWNGEDAAWYPGDDAVDVVALDIYQAKRDYRPHEAAYLEAREMANRPKLIALSETGTLLDPQRLVDSRARWSWFMLWSGDFALTQTWNEHAMMQQVYQSDVVITLDELPPLAR